MDDMNITKEELVQLAQAVDNQEYSKADANYMEQRKLEMEREDARNRWYNRFRCVELAISFFKESGDTSAWGPKDVVAAAAIFQAYLDNSGGHFAEGQTDAKQ